MKSLFDTSTRKEIEARIGSLTADDKALFGTLSPQKALCHLTDSLRLARDTEISKEFKKSFFSSRLGQWFVISSPIPWPKGKIKIEKQLEPYFFGSSPSKEIEEDKKALIKELSNFAKNENGTWGMSPVFGELSPQQWSKLHLRHLDHHLKQFGR